ncbi:MAG: chemotaxis protein CheX [Spirochaetota bacterium]
MQESELKHFVEGTLHYFKEATGEAAKLGLPYIKKPEDEIFGDFTGIIGISGTRRGGIYATCGAPLLAELAKVVSGLENPEPAILSDMAGEIANTIAGNATRAFGKGFDISVPIVLQGAPRELTMKVEPPCYVIPAEWRGHKLYIVVGISG